MYTDKKEGNSVYYSEDIIEEVRMQKRHCGRDFFLCETAKKKEILILDCVRFIMKNPRPFLSAGTSRCITALDAGQEGMCLHS